MMLSWRAGLPGRKHRYVPFEWHRRTGRRVDSSSTGHSPAREIVQLLVPEQYLDDADVDLLLEEVSGERVRQAVHRDRLIDSRRRGGSMDRAVELPRGHRIGRIEAGEEPAVWQDPALGMGQAPPATQPLEQHW